MKKILSIVLAVVLMITALPLGDFEFKASAATSGYYTYSVSNGEATITDVDTSISGDITIPSNLGGYRVTSIGVSAFSGCTSLKSITIPDSVTSIGYYAFMSCSSLTSITIPNSVTSIRDRAFFLCTRLTSINVSSGNSYYSSQDGVLFNKDKTTLVCYPAGKTNTSYVIPDSVTSIGTYAFYKCTSLTSITIPDSVTSIGTYAFRDCTSLTSITIPDSVTSIGDSAFYYCESLTSITLGKGVKSIGYSAFEDCTSLTSITIPDSVTSIGDYAFRDCTSLTSITIPDSVTSIGGSAFYNTGYYNDSNNWVDGVLYIGNHLIMANTSISGSYAIKSGTITIEGFAFFGCESLTSITIPDSVTSIGRHAFNNCSSLTSITIPDSVTSIGSSAFYNTGYYNDSNNWVDGVLYIGNHLIIANTSISGSYAIKSGTITIANGAFYNCTSLTSITIPDSVTSIGEDAFKDCTNLIDVYYGGTEADRANISIGSDNSYLTNATWHYNSCIGSTTHTFDNALDSDCNICGKVRLVSYTISNGEATITDFDENFTGDLVIPETVNGYPVTKIANYAFYKCSGIESITLPEGIKSIGNYAFSYCSSLKEINIPKSVNTIGASAFSQTNALESVTVDANNAYFTAVDGVLFNKAKTELIAYPTAKADTVYTVPEGVTEIKPNTFYYCENLTEINLPSSLTKIGNNAFYYCRQLKNIVIPENVAEIGNLAFFYCSALKSVTLPASLKSIGNSSFRNCPFLSDIYFAGSKTEADKITIGSNNTNLTSAQWNYCGDGSHMYSDNCDTECNICGFIRTAPHTYDDACDKECNNCFAVREAEHAFDGASDVACNNCSKVRYLSYSISNGKVTITKLDTGFEGDLIIPSTINGNPVTKIANYAFYNCSKVESVIIPDGVTSIGGYAFSYCSSLKEINIPNSVNTIGSNAFSQVTALEIINVAEENEYFESIDGVLFNEAVTELIAYPTAKADTVYTVPEGVTEIKANTFYYCENLTEVYLPSSLTKIGDSAFYYCRRLKNIVIPENVTEIGKLAFFYCSALKTVTLPAGINTIGNSAFKSCPFLANVYYCGTKNQAMNISIGANNNQLTFADWTYNYTY